MSSHRVDHLLEELASRYDLQDRFLVQVRPMVAQILSENIPEERRTFLLEVLAQTCQNDLLIRKRFAALEGALGDLIRALSEMGERMRRLGTAPEAG